MIPPASPSHYCVSQLRDAVEVPYSTPPLRFSLLPCSARCKTIWSVRYYVKRLNSWRDAASKTVLLPRCIPNTSRFVARLFLVLHSCKAIWSAGDAYILLGVELLKYYVRDKFCVLSVEKWTVGIIRKLREVR